MVFMFGREVVYKVVLSVNCDFVIDIDFNFDFVVLLLINLRLGRYRILTLGIDERFR